MKYIMLPLALICSMVMQGQSIVVKFSETKRHTVLTLKTPEPLNPGVQGELRILYHKGDSYVVYPDTVFKNGKVRQVEFNTFKDTEILKMIYYIPGDRPFGLAFRPSPSLTAVIDSSKVVCAMGDDNDGDGFASTAVISAQGWSLLLDSDDSSPQISPIADFAYQPLNVNGELVSDINGDGDVELEYSDELGEYDPLHLKFGSREGWLGQIPGAYEIGERVMLIGGEYVVTLVIRGAR